MRHLLGISIGVIVLTSMMCGCTNNSLSKKWGGSETITLEPGKRLINITWKDKTGTNLWILTKQNTTKPSTYTFEEKSSFCIMEGKVTNLKTII